MSRKPVDIANLRRVIELGVAQAAHDAGLPRVAISVIIHGGIDGREVAFLPHIEVEVVPLTEEQAAELTGEEYTN